MINEQTLKGSWNEMRGKIREKWSQLTDNDLGEFQGNVEQLVGRIQQKTGAARSTIEAYLGEISAGAATVVGRMGEAMHSAVGGVQQGFGNAQHAVMEGAAGAEDFIRNRPGQSVAIAFGVGLVAGLGIAAFLQPRPQPTAWQNTVNSTDSLRRQMMNALANVLPESMASHLRS